MSWKRLVLIVSFGIAVFLAIQFRYDIVTSERAAYRLDRWTGEVAFIFAKKAWDVEWEERE